MSQRKSVVVEYSGTTLTVPSSQEIERLIAVANADGGVDGEILAIIVSEYPIMIEESTYHAHGVSVVADNPNNKYPTMFIVSAESDADLQGFVAQITQEPVIFSVRGDAHGRISISTEIRG